MLFFRSKPLLSLLAVAIWCAANSSAQAWYRYGHNNYRSYRGARSSYVNPYAGIQRASASLNAARAEASAAEANVRRQRTILQKQSDNSAPMTTAKSEHDKAERAYEAERTAVVERLKANDPQFQAALKAAQATKDKLDAVRNAGGSTSEIAALEAEFQRQSATVARLETAALEADSAARDALAKRKSAQQQMDSIHKEFEGSVTSSPEWKSAQSKVSESRSKIISARSQFSRAVASANTSYRVYRGPRYYGGWVPRGVNWNGFRYGSRSRYL